MRRLGILIGTAGWTRPVYADSLNLDFDSLVPQTAWGLSDDAWVGRLHAAVRLPRRRGPNASWRHATGRRLRFIDGANGVPRIESGRLLVRDVTPTDAFWMIEHVSRHVVRLERAHPVLPRMGPDDATRIPDLEHDDYAAYLPASAFELGDE